ncbi:hypothetical protein BKA70DRAFT_1294759 [Coprinopsis sp. MPI-PUGE-AT-0042]|nr:hypothetical protein BKA70DRAFT_1294759 [Coprinopsis sp. MPI-PUGE-AT-0042]
MHLARVLMLAGFVLSTTLAAPVLPVEIHDLSARAYDIEPEYAARSWLDEDALVTRGLSANLEELITRDEDHEDFLVARNKLLAAAKMIRTGLKTKPGEAVFWSGNSLRPGGKKPISAGVAASAFAKKEGKSTLQMKLRQEKIPMPKFNPQDRSAQLWRMASKKFASGASGTINAFLGQNVNKKGIYMKEEKPRLMNKPTVSKLIEHIHGKPSQIVKGGPNQKK